MAYGSLNIKFVISFLIQYLAGISFIAILTFLQITVQWFYSNGSISYYAHAP